MMIVSVNLVTVLTHVSSCVHLFTFRLTNAVTANSEHINLNCTRQVKVSSSLPLKELHPVNLCCYGYQTLEPSVLGEIDVNSISNSRMTQLLKTNKQTNCRIALIPTVATFRSQASICWLPHHPLGSSRHGWGVMPDVGPGDGGYNY